MQLDSFLLADAAAALEGKLYVHGGGITRINSPRFPLVQQLAFVLRFLAVDQDDLTSAHTIGVSLTAPDHEFLVPEQGLRIQPPAEYLNVVEGETRAINVALTVNGLVFPAAGMYSAQAYLDGEVVRDLPLPVVLIVPPDPEEEPPADDA
ncbi:MAG: hypothetical protein U0R70_14740 [Solirubrobacteraceae bacterium]